MFELSGVPRDIAINSLKAASYKLPIKCKVIESQEDRVDN